MKQTGQTQHVKAAEECGSKNKTAFPQEGPPVPCQGNGQPGPGSWHRAELSLLFIPPAKGLHFLRTTTIFTVKEKVSFTKQFSV